MNFYVVVEGIGEKQVYKHWIPCVNPELKFAATSDLVNHNSFFIMHGGGLPRYFTVIKNAIRDILEMRNESGEQLFNRLIVCADAEENTYEERR